MFVPVGSTAVSVDVRAMALDGTALAGKAAVDFTFWYRRDAGLQSITPLSDLAALTSVHTPGGVLEISDGWYRVDIPDAAFAAGANRVAIGGTVAGGVLLSAPVTLDVTADDLSSSVTEITNSISGPGADLCTLTVTVDAAPVADADVWLSSDEDGADVVAGTQQTNSNGEVQFMLDDEAEYYLWMQKDGVEPILGELFTAIADPKFIDAEYGTFVVTGYPVTFIVT